MKPLILALPGLLLFAMTVYAAPPAGLGVTLPDAGTYAYWVQSKSGTLEKMPVTVAGKAQIDLGAIGVGGTLYVLDKHTGDIAAEALTGKPLTLTTADFQPVGSGALPAPPPASAIAAPPPVPPETNGFGRLITLLFGLLVAAGVGWVILRLVQSRGQPLIDAARRLGVDVPDPSALPDTEAAAPVYTPPAPRAPDKIPDEAGVIPPPPSAPVQRAGTVGALEAPQLVGLRGVAAGNVYVLGTGQSLVGRDGDGEIVLNDDTVSRRHAHLTCDGAGGLSITDEGSANGVYVNGNRVTQSALYGGDQVQIGDNHFRLDT